MSEPPTTPRPDAADLPPGMMLKSDLAIDRPDLAEELARRQAAGELTAGEVEGLTRFAADGYLVFEPGFDDALLDQVEEDVDRLWRDQPADVAYAWDGPARPMSEADEARERQRRYRLHDIHSHSEAARRLYLDPTIHRWVELAAGQPTVAIQSLYFQYGSEQVLHRDPVVVPTSAPGHLLAAWVALEDIGPDCGALVYVPGSHRLPYYEFAPGEYEFDGARMGAEEIAAATAFDDEMARRAGLAPRIFTARKGQVLLWHASLRHGGSPVTAEGATRRSFVVHFSTAATYTSRAITVVEGGKAGEGAGQDRVMRTERLVEEGGCRGFENPMCGTEAPE